MLPCLPRKVMGVERDTMAADPRTRIKGHETKRFGGGGANHFPGINVQGIAKASHLVCHSYIDGAKSVFQQLGCFGNTGRAHCMHIFDDLGVKVSGALSRVRSDATHDLGNIVGLKLRIAWVDSLRRESQQEVLVKFKTS